jgi:coenzyme F420-reducing hydrogenase delta subunit
LGKPPTIEVRLRWHRRFDGLYARIAKHLGVDPSFVSKVASGTRNSDKITQALETEMKRLEKLKPK